MADVLPFNGLRYNPKQITDMSAVMAPPYDVINAAEQKAFYGQHPNNVIRLILNHIYSSDTKTRNRYSRAASTLQQWQKDEILLRDAKPGYYAYWQDYTLPDGRTYVRKGVLGRLKLSPFTDGVVFGHELTHKKARNDRTMLMEACQTNLSPVFMMYPDSRGTMKKLLPQRAPKKPVVDYTDDAGIRHRMWPLHDVEKNRAIAKAFKSREVYIADGHHRYTASLAYRDQMRKQCRVKGDAPYDYTMTYFTSMHDDGLCVLPIHRFLFDLPAKRIQGLLPKLEPFFSINPVADGAGSLDNKITVLQQQLSAAKGAAFGYFDKESQASYVLATKPKAIQKALTDLGIDKPLQKVDVIILHKLIFENLLGITPKAQEEQRNMSYVKGNADVAAEIRRRPCQCAFLMNPLSLDTLRMVVKAGCFLPQKSTFFYPKLLSGLVFHSLKADDANL
jgi:uncharacterized protein (DUF1015 family)